jgi:hypothetical protein
MKQIIFDGITGLVTEVELTEAEETKRQAEITKSINDETVTETAKIEKDAKAKAGNDKLIALGLSQEEITAMTGYSIPVVSERPPE